MANRDSRLVRRPTSMPINRRTILGAAVATAATSSVATAGAQSERHPLWTIKSVRAGVLDVAYAELGPVGGPPVLLLHGWPYDIHAFAQAAPLLAERGYRVVAPYLRGFGATRFLDASAVRNGQQAALAVDALALMDALSIERAVIAGFDWGARTAVAVAALRPERCKAIVSVSGYILANIAANQRPLPPRAELGWWYQYYFVTERGRLGYQQDRDEFARLIWQLASPQSRFDEATFQRSAAALDNPDHVDIVIHNYRWRLGLAQGEAQYDELEQALQRRPIITVPAITIGSDFGGADADGAAYRDRFDGPYAHRVLPGIGHNVPQEAPRAFADAIIDADRLG
jgi:pimeloyl-ACP methyl ester carboxylesterase